MWFKLFLRVIFTKKKKKNMFMITLNILLYCTINNNNKKYFSHNNKNYSKKTFCNVKSVESDSPLNPCL